MDRLTLGSLFDGSGGFPLGGLLSGIAPLWASEIEPFPIRVTTERLPQMRHLGDVSALDGAELPPVDVITFGSPCQDMSIAGKREGLDGSRSNLFYQAVRIVKEMRCATDGRYPRFVVWENVPGAFSSNKGKDFKAVLEEICKVKDPGVHVPESAKWQNAGEILGDSYSVAWRVLDAQYWGVPQRRRRIYLVGDLAGQCAGQILFESEGLSGYSAAGFRAWQRAAGGVAESAGTAGGLCLNDQGGKAMDVSVGVSGTLRAHMDGHPPCIVEPPAALYENHSQDTRYTGPLDTAPTVSALYGTGGNNQPFIVGLRRTYDVRFTSEGTKSARQNVYETHTARTLDTGGNHPDGNQGGVAVVDAPVAYSLTMCGFPQACKEQVPTLMARDFKDPTSVNQGGAVRRLTPVECARLQGFPGWWCAGLETPEPTEADMLFWTKAWEDHRKASKTAAKPKTRNQIVKWLKTPHSDAAEYKMWGNGVALPCVFFVLAGIVWSTQETSKDFVPSNPTQTYSQ